MSLTLNQYGITLRRVVQEDIELIREWRNHPSIRKTMAYQKKISVREQQEWFKRINNALNYYLMIMVNDQPVGVINCKEVHLKDQYGEGGIFIWDKKYASSAIPSIASIILINYIFNVIHIGNKSFVRILKNNVAAQRYNKMLGYTLLPGQEKNKNQWYILTKEDFNTKRKKLMIGARNFTETDGVLSVGGFVSDLNIPEVNASIGKSFSQD
jgi:RimJ/RimL family protein N-acetyltransferase